MSLPNRTFCMKQRNSWMSGKTILYVIVLIYIVSQVARCDLASTLSARHDNQAQTLHGVVEPGDGQWRGC